MDSENSERENKDSSKNIFNNVNHPRMVLFKMLDRLLKFTFFP